jgi:hypothetical protein
MYDALSHFRQVYAAVSGEQKATEYATTHRIINRARKVMTATSDLGDLQPFVPLHTDLSLSNILVCSRAPIYLTRLKK